MKKSVTKTVKMLIRAGDWNVNLEYELGGFKMVGIESYSVDHPMNITETFLPANPDTIREISAAFSEMATIIEEYQAEPSD